MDSTTTIPIEFSDQSALYKLIIETANEGIWVIDEFNITKFVNPKMADMLGYTVKEMSGRVIFDFMDKEAEMQAIKGLKDRKKGKSDAHEFRLIGKGNRTVWTHMNASPIHINGEYKGALAMVTDKSEAKRNEQKLLDSYHNYISLFEDSPVPIWDEDFSAIKLHIDDLKEKGITDFRTFFSENPDKLEECTSLLIVNNINQAVVDLNEATSKQEVLDNFRHLLTSKSSEYAIEQLVAIAEGRTTCDIEAELKTMNGNIRFVHMKWTVVKGFEHNYKRVYLSTTDMTQRIKDENLSLQHSNREKAVLLKEIHHRVKNNLQIITSLLNLQSHGIEDDAVKNIFNTSLNRIKSMAIVHELLYRSNDFSGIDYQDYLNQLISTLVESMRSEESQIDVNVEAENIHLNISTSVPLGLMINEIITNSLKHGILPDQNGSVYVQIKQLEHPNFEMRIGDNGQGIPNDVDVKDTDTLGLQLVTSLTEQLMGSIVCLDNRPGTHYLLHFQELDQE